ncbi:MAG: bifunctional salicylyl-CoA 5-hydroxylase/oxidoreductase [Limnohabitans sp.]
MNIVCMGGGPAGLYFGLLMKLRHPQHQITVLERNKPYDTFGWGVVFSDATMARLEVADPVTASEILGAFNHWDDIAVHFKGETLMSSGHGFCGIGRKRLLNILQKRCEALGVKLVFETEVDSQADIAAHYQADLVIACDGINSRIRSRFNSTYKADIDERRCRFVWLGTRKLFDAFTFAMEETPHGWIQAHAYQYDGDTSTFIVETPEPVWLAAGLDKMSQEESVAFCEKLFAKYLDGHALMTNASHLRGSAHWIKFPRVICEQWVHWEKTSDGRDVPYVLMGDAAHTAHFSIGSGTKLAFEDAIELADTFERMGHEVKGMPEVMVSYQATRAIEVLKIQNAARNSTEWFENVSRYVNLPPAQFAYSLLTRSQRISHENLRVRDAAYVQAFEQGLAQQVLSESSVAHEKIMLAKLQSQPAPPPMFLPLQARGVMLKNRVMVSPMATYSAHDGVPGDFHLMHYGARAMGGAAIVFTEMTCVTPQGRITPGCPGLWNDAQQAGWARIVDLVHTQSDAKIALQLGHAGRKGSTRRAWDGMDQPLAEPARDGLNWPLLAPSALPYLQGISQVPQAMTRAQMDEVLQAFVSAAKRGAQAGFDWLELHCAHGYLLSEFISPLTNERADEYGGSLENRLRYPLEVFKALREVWPQDRPMSVRISAHDWVEGGITPDDAVEIARYFKNAGVDFVDCSSGQVDKREQPVYGRMFQTPFADRIRNEAGVRTIAVGAISEADHVNSIIAAGRADLCAVARPHLANPSWTMQEAARIGYTGLDWQRVYVSGKRQMETNFERAASMAAQAGLASQGQAQKGEN